MLDKKIKTPWIPHDLLIPIRLIRFSRNAPITQFWKRPKSQLQARIAISAYETETGVDSIPGVKDVKVDLEHERVIVTFDARKTHVPDLHDAILSSGYKPTPIAD